MAKFYYETIKISKFKEIHTNIIWNKNKLKYIWNNLKKYNFIFENVITCVPGMKKFEYKGKQWHEQCFTCGECNQPIGNMSFIPREDRVICVPCYEANYAQRCQKCNEVSLIHNTVIVIHFRIFIFVWFNGINNLKCRNATRYLCIIINNTNAIRFHCNSINNLGITIR